MASGERLSYPEFLSHKVYYTRKSTNFYGVLMFLQDTDSRLVLTLGCGGTKTEVTSVFVPDHLANPLNACGVSGSSLFSFV